MSGTYAAASKFLISSPTFGLLYYNDRILQFLPVGINIFNTSLCGCSATHAQDA